MKLNISENRIRRIVSETLNRFILRESFTNMKQLYHATPLDTLFNIIKSNSFYLMPSNHGGRGGKYYASLTRHKNNIEGFDCLMYAKESQENYIESYATITFNISKMSRIHGISIKPFDYYATETWGSGDDDSYYGHSGNYDDDSYDDDDLDLGIDDDYDSNDHYNDVVNSKMTYQMLKKPIELMSYDEQDKIDLGDFDSPEYYNMAEENIVSDTVKEIPNIFNYIDRIDIYFPADLPKYHMEYNPYADAEEEEENYGYDETVNYAYAVCMAICGTEWERKVVVNLTKDGKTQSTISINDFNEWLNSNEDYKKHANVGKSYVNKNHISRNEFYNEYEGHYHGHGHH
jgi:hypothetical protein